MRGTLWSPVQAGGGGWGGPLRAPGTRSRKFQGRQNPARAPHYLTRPSLHFRSQPLPWAGGAKGNQPPAQLIPTHRASLCYCRGGHDQRGNQGSRRAALLLPPNSRAPSAPGTPSCFFPAFPAIMPGPGGREASPMFPAVLECTMKSPACKRKGLCFHG